MQRTLLSIMFIVFVILLILNVFAFEIYESASKPISFESLLTELANAPTIDMTLSETIEEFKIDYDGSSKIISAVVDIVNAIESVFGFIAWIGIVVINLVSYIIYFIYLLGVQGVSAWI